MKRTILHAALVLALSLAAMAPMFPAQTPAGAPSFPDTPAGRRLAAWLPVLNGGDAAAIEKFVKENFAARALQQAPADERAEVHKRFFAQTGGLKVTAVRDLGANEIEVRAQAIKSGEWFRIGLRTEPEAPNGILGFRFEEAAPPESAASQTFGKVAEAELSKAVGDYVGKLAAEDRFSGSVLVAKNGAAIFSKAYGKSSAQTGAANALDTKFNLGSMNKMFTAVSIGQLVDQGKLSFDDKVGKYLPDFPNPDVRNKVAIHHLLTHTSGLGSYFGDPGFDEGGPKIRTVNDYMAFVKTEQPAFEPGDRFQYSNSGFIVLGAIIEKITGQSYYDYVRDHVFKAAGMNNSACYAIDEKVANLAVGYIGSIGRRTPNTDTLPGRGGPAGGGYSTAEDLLKFERALRDNKLVTVKTRDILLAGKVSMGGPNAKYAYGFGDLNYAGHRMVGHNGGAPGINSELQMFWDEGYTIIVMANYDRGATPVANNIRTMIFGAAR